MFQLFADAAKTLLAFKSEQSKGKSPLRSKTVCVLILTTVACALSQYCGITLSAGEQTTIITTVGIFMRLISKSPVGFYEDKS